MNSRDALGTSDGDSLGTPKGAFKGEVLGTSNGVRVRPKEIRWERCVLGFGHPSDRETRRKVLSLVISASIKFLSI